MNEAEKAIRQINLQIVPHGMLERRKEILLSAAGIKQYLQSDPPATQLLQSAFASHCALTMGVVKTMTEKMVKTAEKKWLFHMFNTKT